MASNRAELPLLLCISAALLLSACLDSAQAPPARPDPPTPDAPEGSTLAPIDLVYVCGNRFLATNATGRSVEVQYRVVGTDERGTLSLVEGPDQDPGYGETELRTTERGVVELYQDDRRIARRRNQGAPCGASPAPIPSAATAAVGPATAGAWSAPFPWRVVATHAHLLPNGRVLSWGAEGSPQVWSPSTRRFTAVASSSLLFCSGHSFLTDGRLLVSGGHIDVYRGTRDNNLFTTGSQTWSRSTAMRRGRWYPTNTTLSNGDVLILAGTDENAAQVTLPEVWSSGAIRVLSSSSRALPYYPRAFLAPNGMIFYAGEERRSRYLNTSGTGTWTVSANRLYGTRDYGAAVMYDNGKVLYVGGGRTTNTAEIIDLNQSVPAWHWTGWMAYPRRHLNATVLPTGEVLVTGGTGGTAFNDLTKAVRVAELWSPATGIWRKMASNAVSRGYHSTSILLPSGRVLHAGSGDAAAAPNENNAELFSPPYLYKGARPTITSAPSLVGYGTKFSVTSPQYAGITKVSFIRLGSVTHAFDMNQRFQRLSFVRGSGKLTVSAPTNRNRTPPGHYMLFILNGDGVPSVAKIVQIK